VLTKIEWSARVESQEPVDDPVEFARMAKKGLIDAEIIPEDGSRVTTISEFMGKTTVIVVWHTENELALTENYKA
jgi:hypothetical protein